MQTGARAGAVGALVYAAGYEPGHAALDDALIDEAVAAASGADAAIILAGAPAERRRTEAEGRWTAPLHGRGV